MKILQILVIPSLLISLTGCLTNKNQQKIADSIITQQVKQQLEEHERIAGERVKEALKLPNLPKECQRLVTTDILSSDTNDVAISKLDIALYGANLKIKNCSNFYNNQKKKRDNFEVTTKITKTNSYVMPNKPKLPSKRSPKQPRKS